MVRRLRARSRFAALCLSAFGVLVSVRAAAHQVWLERDAGGTKLYFGEWGDNLHEVSPGYLDKLARPTATLLLATGEKALAISKRRDGFSIAGRARKGESLIVVDPAYPLIEGTAGDKPSRTLWTPAARLVGSLVAQTPRLALDIVPTGAAGEFQVFFRGAPLPRVELTLVAASGWSRQATSDESGKLRFSLPWQGTYALLVRHKQEVSGSRPKDNGAETYDRVSFATTLTFTTTEGLPSPPPPPAAAPSPVPAKK